LKAKKIILFIIISLAVIGFAIGYIIWNKPHRDVKDANAISESAVAVYNLFTSDSTKAKTIYENKILTVSGEVRQVSLNQKNEQIILLKTNTDGGNINCTMEENIANPKPGEVIKLKGICSGYIGGDADMGLPGDVFLVRCYPVTP
jgi:hypothetical protein